MRTNCFDEGWPHSARLTHSHTPTTPPPGTFPFLKFALVSPTVPCILVLRPAPPHPLLCQYSVAAELASPIAWTASHTTTGSVSITASGAHAHASRGAALTQHVIRRVKRRGEEGGGEEGSPLDDISPCIDSQPELRVLRCIARAQCQQRSLNL